MRAIVLASTALVLIASAAAAYDPVVDTRKIMAATVTTKSIQNEYLSGKRDGTAVFQRVKSAYISIREAEVVTPPPPATQTCPDGTVIPATSTCPVPPPPPPDPIQCPDGSSVIPPATCPVVVPPPPPPEPVVSLAGLPPIASNFDFNAALISPYGGIPASGAPDIVGSFRFICGAGQINYDDPILFPGQPGKSHLHQYYGNVTANAHSTYASLRAAGDSTCNWTGTGQAANRSAYWMPAMLDGKGNVVRPFEVSIYYKQRPQSDPTVRDPTNAKYLGKAIQLPNGIKFIFGWDPTGLTQMRTGQIKFYCRTPSTGAATGHSTLASATANCPAGNDIGAQIEAPECWDGKTLDAPDHRSHVSYASYGTWGYLKCPATHPYNIPTFTLGAWYKIQSVDTPSLWELSSDHMAPGQPKGHTFHADFFMAWDPTVHDMWWQNCINKLLNCSGGQLGNDKGLKGAASHNLKRDFGYSTRLVPVSGI
jgi:hypothetical protein